MRKFAITDVHGCNKTLDALLDKIELTTKDELYFLGDYIDRGPDSKGVFDSIFDLKEKGFLVNCIRGNHEQMLLNCFDSVENQRFWYINGGQATLKSFKADHFTEIPSQYLDFIKSLPFYLEVDEYLLTHAGFNFELSDPLIGKKAMLWARNWYHKINYDWLGNRIILHGHTPTPLLDIKGDFELIDKKRVLDLDAGCVYSGRRVGLGYLLAFDMTNKNLTIQENVE